MYPGSFRDGPDEVPSECVVCRWCRACGRPQSLLLANRVGCFQIQVCSVTALSLRLPTLHKMIGMTVVMLIQTSAWITLKEDGPKRNCGRCLATSKRGAQRPFDGQLARKCAKDWALPWIMGPRMTLGSSEWPCRLSPETITGLKDMPQRL